MDLETIVHTVLQKWLGNQSDKVTKVTMVIRVKWATMSTWVTSWTGWYGWNEMSIGLLYPNRFYDFPKLLLIILSLPNVGNAPVPLINAPTLKSSKSGNFSSGVGNRGQWTLDIPPPHQPRSFFILNIISLSVSSVRIVGNYSSLTSEVISSDSNRKYQQQQEGNICSVIL